MLPKNFITAFIAIAALVFGTGCSSRRHKVELASGEYDLNKPSKLILSDALSEISGISFYPKDSSVFAISDETGYLYKIHLRKGFRTEEWLFDKKRDYEDVVLYDSSFYVLESTGNIEKITVVPRNKQDAQDTVLNRRSVFPGDNQLKREFESLYYDDEYNGFVMICKDCEDDDSKSTTAWLYDPVQDKYTESVFKIPLDEVAKKIGLDKIKFRPSAAAINPLTHDVWVVCSGNGLIVVMDHKGNMKDVYTLNTGIFNKPEGITFTPWGDLLISNEAGDKYSSATLLIFKPKKIKG
ncbi:MAG: hypothetical protein ABI683_04310 [Ginsengibacter sp.]